MQAVGGTAGTAVCCSLFFGSVGGQGRLPACMLLALFLLSFVQIDLLMWLSL